MLFNKYVEKSRSNPVEFDQILSGVRVQTSFWRGKTFSLEGYDGSIPAAQFYRYVDDFVKSYTPQAEGGKLEYDDEIHMEDNFRIHRALAFHKIQHMQKKNRRQTTVLLPSEKVCTLERLGVERINTVTGSSLYEVALPEDWSVDIIQKGWEVQNGKQISTERDMIFVDGFGNKVHSLIFSTQNEEFFNAEDEKLIRQSKPKKINLFWALISKIKGLFSFHCSL